MKPEELMRKLDRDELASVYFLFGTERFYQTEIIGALIRLIINPENKEFNLETFEAKTSEVEEWIAAANTYSFFGGRKLVTVRNLHDKSLDVATAQPLLEYLEQPAPETCLVLTADKIDRKRKLDKALSDLKTAVECSPPPEYTLPDWLQKRAKSRGFQMSLEAARMMVDRLGPKPGFLTSELEKVITYSGGSKKIDVTLIGDVIGAFKLESVFDLTNALKSKNPGEALRLLANQLKHGEEPLKILGAIIWQFRFIWEVRHHLPRQLTAAQIARAMGSRPFVVEKAMPFAEAFSQRELKKGFKDLFQADRELKTTGREPVRILEGLILKLCSTG